MPWGAERLNDPSALFALKAAVCVDIASPTGLAWRREYVARRAVPGAPAGGFETRLQQPTIRAKGYPLYARHAVWMLVHDSPLPEGMDVAFADGNKRNLNPSNLTLVPRVRAPSAVPRNPDAFSQAAKDKARMPKAIRLDHQQQGWVVFIHIRKRAIPLAVVDTAKEALVVAFCAAMAFNYYPEAPLPMPDELKARITKRALLLYTPLTRFTPSQDRIKTDFMDQLRLAMKSVEANK